MMTMTLPDTNASLTHRHSHQTSIISNVNEQFVHNHGAQAAKAAHCEIAVWHEFGTSTTATAAAAAATSQQQQQHHSNNNKKTQINKNKHKQKTQIEKNRGFLRGNEMKQKNKQIEVETNFQYAELLAF